MLNILSKNWLLMVLRGVLSIVFGILMIIWPDVTVQVLVLLFGLFALMDGVYTSVLSIIFRNVLPNWGLALANGLVTATAGIVAFVWTDITATILLFLIGIWAIVGGIFSLATAIYLRKEMDGEWRMAFSGIISILAGMILVLSPGVGAVGMVWLIAAEVIISGIMFIGIGLFLRRISEY